MPSRTQVEPVAPGLVDHRSLAERPRHRLGQGGQLALLKVGRKVAGEGMEGADHFLEGRVHPGMELRADQAFPGREPGTEDIGARAAVAIGKSSR